MAAYAQWLSYLILREILIGRYCYHAHCVGVVLRDSHHIRWPESSGCKQQGWDLNPCCPSPQSVILSPASAALLALPDHHKGCWVHILLTVFSQPCAYSHISGPWKSKASKNNQSLLAPDLPIHSLGHSYGLGWCAGVGPRAIEPRWVRWGVSSLQLQMLVGRRHQVNR